MSRVIKRIPQIDGSVRVVLAQDDRHAAIARQLLRDNPAWIDRLDGIDGIKITTSSK